MAVPNQFTAPNVNEYGGDEVSALVLDPGYATIRAGFGGEDTPKSVMPTYYGSQSETGETLFGDNEIHEYRPKFDIKNPMSADGIVEDWDVAQKLWETSITSRLLVPRPNGRSKSGQNGAADGEDITMEDVDEAENSEKPMTENPLLVSEPAWNPAKNREKAIEIAMEDWGVPAFFLNRAPPLAMFSNGKQTALVVDVGASTASVTPVVEGLVIKKGVKHSQFAGSFISEQIRLIFAQSQPPVPLTPRYKVASKAAVDAGAPSQAKLKTFAEPPTPSFNRLEEDRVLTEFKESVVQIWPGPNRLSSGSQGSTNEDLVRSQGRPFEMPDGWNQMFGAERYKAAEALFDSKAALTSPDTRVPTAEETIPAMIHASLNAVDVELRPYLLANVVLVGGSSLIQGMDMRLQAEISTIYPSPRVRIHVNNTHVERKYASWIGGSILASCGSFHQLWISQKEYQESGASIVEKRCK